MTDSRPTNPGDAHTRALPLEVEVALITTFAKLACRSEEAASSDARALVAHAERLRHLFHQARDVFTKRQKSVGELLAEWKSLEEIVDRAIAEKNVVLARDTLNIIGTVRTKVSSLTSEMEAALSRMENIRDLLLEVRGKIKECFARSGAEIIEL